MIENFVTVVIPCRNERGHIARCLDSVLGQFRDCLNWEVIVADGMSTDGTREILVRYAEAEPRIRVINNPGQIVSTGLNVAIRAAQGNIIIRMDAHTSYAPDYITRCAETLGQTGSDSVGGPWLAEGSTYASSAIAAGFQSPFAVGGARGHDAAYGGPVDTVYLGCWRREAFEKFGYFDEELVRNQDDEHNLRIIRGGGMIYQSPRIRSWYKPRNSLSALFRQYMQYGYWKVRVIQKHKLPASWRHLVPGGFVLALSVLLLLSAFCFLLSRLNSDLQSLTTAGKLASGLLGVASVSYATAVIAASVHTAARSGWKLLPLLPLVFPCYHFGYGFGFLRGVLDFIILRRGGSKSFTKLTRESAHASK